jgi:uncharacterized membrane protein
VGLKARIQALWFLVRGSYWFVPGLMVGAAVALSVAAITIDHSFRGRQFAGLVGIYAGGAEGARSLLSTVASSMINVATLAFSITMVVLSLASSQLGPRLLTRFMRDTGNQVVLGTFVATFVYCLLVLRTVRAEPEFVPHVSVTVAIGLAVVSVGVLIYFIHHVAVGIQADRVIAVVARDLDGAIDEMFPRQLDERPAGDAHRSEVPLAFTREARPLRAQASGYIRAIDRESLLALAAERDLVVELVHRPGHFVTRGSVLARVWPPDRVEEPVIEAIHEVIMLGAQRTLEQDVEFAVTQLVEIALRALSPGVNDPFTAVACVDRLGAAVARLAEREMPPPHCHDDAGNLRVIVHGVDFAGAVDAAFDQIRQAARGNVAVSLRLLEAITVVLECVRLKDRRAALLAQAAMVYRGAREEVPEPADRAAIEARYERLREMAPDGEPS